MADVKFRIIAKDEASADIRKVDDALDDLGKSAQDAGKGGKDFGLDWTMVLTGINQGLEIANKAIEAFKRVIEFSQEGAALMRLEESSASMAASVGQDMDDIVIAVRDASKGMVSDAAIMQSATRALMLGVGQSADDMAKLMEVAAVRGRAMGVSTEQAFNDIVTGIGRQSRMILDNLGIVLDLEQVYADYAIQLGKTAKELTDVEKKQAMVNAVIADTAPLLEEMGGVILDSAGHWEVLQSAQENYFNDLKKNTVGFGEAWARVWGEVFTEGRQQMQLDALIEDLQAAGVSMYDIKQIMGEPIGGTSSAGFFYDAEKAARALDKAFGYLLKTDSELKNEMAASDEHLIRMAKSMGYLGDDTEIVAGKTEHLAAVFSEWGLSMNAAAAEATALAEAASLKEMDQYYRTIIRLSDRFGDSLEDISEKQDRINQLTAIAKTGGYLDGVWVSAKKARDEIGEIEGEINDLKDAMTSMANQAVIDMAIAELAVDGIIDEQDFAMIQTLKVALGEMPRDAADETIKEFQRAERVWELLEFASKSAIVRVHFQNLFSGNYQGVPNWWDLASGGIVNAGGHAAAGLPIHAAGGYWVGEAGPEPFFPAQSGRIVSNGEATRALREGGGSRGNSPIVVNINTPINLADRAWVEQELAPYIRDEIQKVQIRG